MLQWLLFCLFPPYLSLSQVEVVLNDGLGLHFWRLALLLASVAPLHTLEEHPFDQNPH